MTCKSDVVSPVGCSTPKKHTTNLDFFCVGANIRTHWQIQCLPYAKLFTPFLPLPLVVKGGETKKINWVLAQSEPDCLRSFTQISQYILLIYSTFRRTKTFESIQNWAKIIQDCKIAWQYMWTETGKNMLGKKNLSDSEMNTKYPVDILLFS